MQARRKIIDGVLNFVDNTGRRSLYFKKIFSGYSPKPAVARRLLFAATGFGSACAAGTSLAPSPWPFIAKCEDHVGSSTAALPGALFMWGKRFTGNDQVGYCDKAPVEISIGGKKVAHLAFGTSVGCACDRNGDVWWWSEKERCNADKAQVILSGKRIVKVACAAKHSYALSRNGRIWQWSNENPRSVTEVAIPGGMLFAGTAVDISSCATGDHLLCVTSDGRALAMGSGSRGQLGLGNCEDKADLTDVLLPRGTRATNCAAGARHSLLLTHDGTVLAFGADDVMQLGQGRQTITQWRADKEPLTSEMMRVQPSKIQLPNTLAHAGGKCIGIAAGHDFSAAIFQMAGQPNCLVTWGNGWRKQLGHKNDLHMSAPKVVTSLQGKKEWNEKEGRSEEMGVAAVACGHEHTVVLLDNGSLVSWGGNREGEVGNDSRADVKTPQMVMPLQRYRIAHIFAGGRSSAALVLAPAAYL